MSKQKIQLSDHFDYSRLIRFVLPCIGTMLFTSIYGIVDGLCVSNFVGKTAFAAVNLIMPVPMLVGTVGFMLGTGGSAIVGITLGEGDNAKADRYFSLFMSTALIAGIVLSVLGMLLLRPVAMMLGAEGEMLDYALRTVLGDHAHQAGSLVEPDRLRYDFTHFSAVTADELVKISRLVSELVLDGMPVETKEMPIAEAKKLGAIALFGEKYGDVVRVVNMGGKSIELCGGTHVDNTAKVGPFRITSESSVASGVRRIEAVTGEAFLNLVDEMNMRLVKAAELLKTTPMELINKAQSSMNEIRELHQTIERMKDKLFAGDVDSLMFSAKDVNGLKVVTASRENTDANDLRKLGDFLRDKNPNTVAALGAVNGEKVTLLAVCGKNAVARGIKAGDIIKNIAPIVGGKGGGKPDSAMGGGTNALKLDDALAAVDDFVAEHLK
jgi:alanyl-tRNA synthetase